MAVSAPPTCAPTPESPSSPLDALIEEARRRQRRRRRLSALALVLASAIAAGAYLALHRGTESSGPQPAHPPAAGAAAHRSPIRVTLTAHNHYPHASNSPYVHWGYCVKVRTTAGEAPASKIHLLLEIVNGRTPVAWVGEVWLNRGYDNWCGGIGGETNALLAVPQGKKLIFRAVVTAMGVTVARNWPIVVR